MVIGDATTGRIRRVILVLSIGIGGLAVLTSVATAAQLPWQNQKLSPDQRADLLEGQMTSLEKVDPMAGTALCGDGGDGYVAGIPQLDWPAINLVGAGMGVTDICHRASDGQATELPAPIAMAASWIRWSPLRTGS